MRAKWRYFEATPLSEGDENKMSIHLAIAGSTGAVGQEVCRIVEQRRLRIGRLSLLASARSAGKVVTVNGRSIAVQELTEHSFAGVDAAIFSAGAERSRTFAPAAVRAGVVVIDNSSAFRMDPEVPLVVPGINDEDARKHRGLVAVPNCSAIILCMAVWPLHRVNPIQRIVVSTYQAVSGAGAAAMEELRMQSEDYLAGRPVRPQVFPHPIAFNLFSHNTPVGPDGYNGEERKVIEETRKILHAPGLAISATCVRVPVFRAHTEAVHLTLTRTMEAEEAREILAAWPGVRVVDDAEMGRFPMPVEAAGGDEVLVGRIRQDESQPDGRGLALLACGDQLRKGAALTAVEIVEGLWPGTRGNGQ